MNLLEEPNTKDTKEEKHLKSSLFFFGIFVPLGSFKDLSVASGIMAFVFKNYSTFYV